MMVSDGGPWFVCLRVLGATDKNNIRLTSEVRKKNKQDMTVPFARARAKLGGSIRYSDVTVKDIII